MKIKFVAGLCLIVLVFVACVASSDSKEPGDLDFSRVRSLDDLTKSQAKAIGMASLFQCPYADPEDREEFVAAFEQDPKKALARLKEFWKTAITARITARGDEATAEELAAWYENDPACHPLFRQEILVFYPRLKEYDFFKVAKASGGYR